VSFTDAATTQSLLNQATILLNSVTAYNTVEEDYKTAFGELIDYYTAPKSYSCFAGTLLKAAEKCPSEYPKSVAITRGLASIVGAAPAEGWTTCTNAPGTRSQASDTKAIGLYPNPTSGIITFKQPAMTVQVINSLGAVLQESIQPTSTLDLGHVIPGMYIITYSIESGQTFSEKIIKL